MAENDLNQVYIDIINGMQNQGIKVVEDLPTISLEYPFIYKGMPIEEYWRERAYYSGQIKNLDYKPLWKQRGEKHDKFSR